MNPKFRSDLLAADVVELIQAFERHDVRYLLIGGHAVFFHGYTRLTADVDFAYDRSEANANRLFAALVEFWGGIVPAIDAANELQADGIVVQFGRPPNRVDLLSSPPGLDFERAWTNRIRAVIGDPSAHEFVSIIPLVDLRACKAAAARAKDLDDLANLPLPDGEE